MCCWKKKKSTVETMLDKASELATQAQGYVAPYIEEAVERVKPAVDSAVKTGREHAHELQERFNDEVVPAVRNRAEELQHRLNDEVVPALKDRAHDARETLVKDAPAALKDYSKAEAKKSRKGKFLLFTLLTSATAGLGYLLWRRSQPLEDPWAEEYWEELNRENLEEAKDEAADKAAELKEEAADKAKDLKAKAEEKFAQAKEKVAKGAEAGKEKLEEVAEKVEDKLEK